jgi:hypothetical protein
MVFGAPPDFQGDWSGLDDLILSGGMYMAKLHRVRISIAGSFGGINTPKPESSTNNLVPVQYQAQEAATNARFARGSGGRAANAPSAR